MHYPQLTDILYVQDDICANGLDRLTQFFKTGRASIVALTQARPF